MKPTRIPEWACVLSMHDEAAVSGMPSKQVLAESQVAAAGEYAAVNTEFEIATQGDDNGRTARTTKRGQLYRAR